MTNQIDLNLTTTLPTVTEDTLAEYLTANKDDVDAYTMFGEVAAKLYSSIPVENNLYLAKDKVPNIISKKKLSQEQDEVVEKRKANADTLALILNQSSFGSTGVFVKLLHSGFSVRLKPLTATEKVDIEYRIANSIIKLDRSTAGHIHTALHVKIMEVVLDTFISKIDYTTVNVNNDKLLKLIKVKDNNLILMALIVSMYPNGYNYAYLCGEKIKSTNPDEGDTLCGNIYTNGTDDRVKINLEEMLYLRDDLTEVELAQINKTTKASITEAEVIKYQENFKYNQPDTLEISEFNLSITIDSGNNRDYLSTSNQWVTETIIGNEQFNRDDIDSLLTLANASAVGEYIYCIDRIESPTHYADKKTINSSHVDILSSNKGITNLIVNASISHLNKSIYTLGVPKYTCPTCEGRMKKEGIEIPEEEVLTNINILTLFWYLV